MRVIEIVRDNRTGRVFETGGEDLDDLDVISDVVSALSHAKYRNDPDSNMPKALKGRLTTLSIIIQVSPELFDNTDEG